jgi:hypothetical protein
MQLDRYSFLQGIAAERRRAFAEVMAMREAVEALKAEALAALDDARATKLEYLSFRQSVTRDRETLLEIERTRQFTVAQMAERDPAQLLQ